MSQHNFPSRGSRRRGLTALALGLCSALLALASISAQARGPGSDYEQRRLGQAPVVIAEVAARAEERFLAADADNDDLISLQEMPALRPNKDHFPGRRKRGGPVSESRFNVDMDRDAMASQIEDERFSILDSDDDGVVSREESQAADPRQVHKQAAMRVAFAQLDVDANGGLSREELPSPVERLRALDSNDDGEVDRREMRSARKDFEQMLKDRG